MSAYGAKMVSSQGDASCKIPRGAMAGVWAQRTACLVCWSPCGYKQTLSPHLLRVDEKGGWFKNSYTQDLGSEPTLAMVTARPRPQGLLNSALTFPASSTPCIPHGISRPLLDGQLTERSCP